MFVFTLMFGQYVVHNSFPRSIEGLGIHVTVSFCTLVTYDYWVVGCSTPSSKKIQKQPQNDPNMLRTLSKIYPNRIQTLENIKTFQNGSQIIPTASMSIWLHVGLMLVPSWLMFALPLLHPFMLPLIFEVQPNSAPKSIRNQPQIS